MSLATGFARSFTMIFSTRFLTGAGQGCFFSNDRPIITAYTPRDKMGLGQGVSFMGLGIGMTLGMLLAGVIIDAFGWRYVFIFYSIPCFIAGTLIAIVIKQPKREVMRSDPVKRASYRLIFKNRDLWLLYASGIAAIYVLWVLGTWTPKMFQEIGVKKLASMATFSSLLGVAGVPGLLITGLVSDALVRRGIGRKIVIATEYVALAVLMVLIGYAVQVKASVTVLSILVFLAGFFVWGIWAPMYALIPELVPREILGTTYGLTNTFHFTGSLLSPWLTGWIRDVTGSFAWGAYLAGAFIFISALVLMGMRPVYRLGPDVPIKVT